MNLKDIERLKYDSRMVDINLKARALTKEELQKHLDKLPDLASNCAALDLDNQGSDNEEMNGSHHQ